MNRLAVVLAADSATTVQSWVNGKQEERYFKGANKIFQLSDAHPIGVMIFDSADLLRVPWETTVKAFRKDLQDKSFNDVEGYAKEFFQFLSDNKRFFPDEVREADFRRGCIMAALHTAMTAKEAAGLKPSGELEQSALDKHLVSARDAFDAGTLRSCFTTADIDSALARFKDAVLEELLEYRDRIHLPEELSGLSEHAIRRVFYEPDQFFSTTGLVFAGFGDHDVFPRMISYRSCGFVIDRHVFDVDKDESIDQDVAASINAFAQTSMTDTFVSGLSFDVYRTLMEAVTEAHQECGKDLGDAGHLVEGSVNEAVHAALTQARKRIGSSVLDRARNEHGQPLRRVLAVLPVDELGELAETLIRLQSLKEKMTSPSASVGGPIDVAVITRSEGLVWIKRKHFFDQPLNPRYFQRQLRR